MVLAIAFLKNKRGAFARRMPKSWSQNQALQWTGGLSLTRRILAINIFALALLAGGFFYLDSYRNRLIEDRLGRAEQNIKMLNHAIQATPETSHGDLVQAFALETKSRIRIYDRNGRKLTDSFESSSPAYAIQSLENETLANTLARYLDIIIDFVAGSNMPPDFTEPASDIAAAWPEIIDTKASTSPNTRYRLAPDRTPIITATTINASRGWSLLSTENATDITQIVRSERATLGIVILVVALVSILLSLFLARTIVRPLRRLAQAAVRVRLGRAREVTVPRLPSRNDEIGLLARSLSDMSIALRQKIDSTEAFAADVTHELKNPIASLRSALEGLGSITDPELQKQLIGIANDDVRRIDRLISDISDASRIDAELANTHFEAVDLGEMVEQLLSSREQRHANGDTQIAFAKPKKSSAIIFGDDIKLERVIENLLDNAVSFSPPNAVIEISATQTGEHVLIRVTDNGPGVDLADRSAIFDRFHSDRPEQEDFGKHSGLGLAIAKTIIEGHNGAISVKNRTDGASGACFEIMLPLSGETN